MLNLTLIEWAYILFSWKLYQLTTDFTEAIGVRTGEKVITDQGDGERIFQKERKQALQTPGRQI